VISKIMFMLAFMIRLYRESKLSVLGFVLFAHEAKKG